MRTSHLCATRTRTSCGADILCSFFQLSVNTSGDEGTHSIACVYILFMWHSCSAACCAPSVPPPQPVACAATAVRAPRAATAMPATPAARNRCHAVPPRHRPPLQLQQDATDTRSMRPPSHARHGQLGNSNNSNSSNAAISANPLTPSCNTRSNALPRIEPRQFLVSSSQTASLFFIFQTARLALKIDKGRMEQKQKRSSFLVPLLQHRSTAWICLPARRRLRFSSARSLRLDSTPSPHQ